MHVKLTMRSSKYLLYIYIYNRINHQYVFFILIRYLILDSKRINRSIAISLVLHDLFKTIVNI